MPLPKALSVIQEKEMTELYKDGATVRELQNIYGISYSTVTKYLKRNGAWGGEKAPILEHYKLCPKCEAHSTPEARFCFKCGYHFKSENEILADKLKGFAPNAKFLPEHMRDDFIQSMLAASKILSDLV